MITKKMESALNEQINAELWSAYLYLAMSLDAEEKALKGIANWFYIQWLEEQDHARIFQEYLSDIGARVELKEIEGVPQEWDSALEMYRVTLRHEKDVTEMIWNLVRLALKEQDIATLSRLQWFVDEQIEEERNAADLVKYLESAKGDYAALRDIDNKLADREYEKASALK